MRKPPAALVTQLQRAEAALGSALAHPWCDPFGHLPQATTTKKLMNARAELRTAIDLAKKLREGGA